MSISTEEWMSLMDIVIEDTQSRNNPTPKVDRFFWEKYCALHQKVYSYCQKIETNMFSYPSTMLQRIFLHRTQEYDGLNAKIGIPLAFKLKQVDYNSTFTERTYGAGSESSYAEF